MELQYEYIPKGGAVFRYGEYGEKFYIILKGEVAVKILDPEIQASSKSSFLERSEKKQLNTY